MQETRRHLPHLYAPGKPVFVTFRLHGTLPEGRSFPAKSLTSGKAFVCMDRMLDDERAGPSYLKQPAIAKVVISYIAKGATYDYILHAWVVMSNHVHMLITPLVDLPALMLDSRAALRGNATCCLAGQAPFGGTRVTTVWCVVQRSSIRSRTTFCLTPYAPGLRTRRRTTHGRVAG